MKKILTLILALCMIVMSFSACGGETKETESESLNAGTEGGTENATEQENETETEAVVNDFVEMEFAGWSEDYMSAIYYISENVYDSFMYTGDVYELDGYEWNCVDATTIYLTLNWYDGSMYVYGSQWEQFFRDRGHEFGYEDAAPRFCTAVYDIDGDGNDDYLATMPYATMFGDPVYGSWVNGEVELSWDTVDGSYIDPVIFTMMVVVE